VLLRRTGQSSCGLDSGFHLREDGARVLEKNVAGGSQFDTADRASEETRADFVFEVANLPAQRGLRGVKPLAGRE
jgi:hypothetical protein